MCTLIGTHIHTCTHTHTRAGRCVPLCSLGLSRLTEIYSSLPLSARIRGWYHYCPERSWIFDAVRWHCRQTDNCHTNCWPHSPELMLKCKGGTDSLRLSLNLHTCVLGRACEATAPNYCIFLELASVSQDQLLCCFIVFDIVTLFSTFCHAVRERKSHSAIEFLPLCSLQVLY